MPNATLRLVRNASTLYDFQSASVNVLSEYSPAPYLHEAQVIEDRLLINPTGTTQALFYDNLVTLFRVLEDAAFGYEQWQNGKSYTPIFLEFADPNLATSVMRTEVFGGDRGEIQNFMSAALRAKVIPNFELTIKRRPYWEEQTAQTLLASTSTTNDGSSNTISGIRGDVPAALRIKVVGKGTNQDRIIVGVKAKGTVANFVCKYEAEINSDVGADVTALVDTNFSGGNGARWTPTSGEQRLILWRITSNLSDQMGTYRVYVRCRDKAATCNTKIRVRAGIYNTANDEQWGDYADIAKYADGTGSSGGSVVEGTTAIALVDCGVIDLPPIDTGGMAPAGYAIELRGEVNALVGAGNEFDIDCLFLMPCYELPMNRGLQVVTFPYGMGNNARPDGVIDSNDRVAKAYLDSSGTLAYPAADIRGGQLYGWTSTSAYASMKVFVLHMRTDTMVHSHAVTPDIEITSRARYRFARGS